MSTSPLGVQHSGSDNGCQSSDDPDDLRGIARNAAESMPGSTFTSAEQRPSTKRARIARSMSDAALFDATGLRDRQEAEARFATDRTIRRPRRARPGLVL